MNAPRLTDAQISEALSAHVPERAPAGLRGRIMEAVHATTQQRPMPSLVVRATALGGLRRGEGARPNRWALVLVAAMLLTLLAAAAIFVAGQRGPLLATLPEPTTTPATTPTPSAEVSPSPAVASTKLTWTKVALDGRSPRVAWLGDQFVLVDQDSGAVRTSTDGASWQVLQPGDPDPGYVAMLRGALVSWQDQAVGWNPGDRPDVTNGPPLTSRDVLRIVRPPAEPTETTPFKGRIESIGIGPIGIVAQVHSHLDWDAWVATKLGDDWVSRYEEVSFKDGILEITMKRGRGLKVVWADEGFELGDFQDAGFGWYSPDGEQWTQMPVPAWSADQDSGLGFPTGFGDVVGVSDGFIARGVDTSCSSPDGCAGMWFSSDGLTWNNIGNVPNGHEGELLPWMGDVLLTDGVGRFDFWTSEGHSELPMAEEIRAASKENAAFGAGPLGLVTVLTDDHEILVTRDGVDWDIQPMPAEMTADQTVSRAGPSVVVGERSVLVLVWSGSYEARIPSLWRGSLEP